MRSLCVHVSRTGIRAIAVFCLSVLISTTAPTASEELGKRRLRADEEGHQSRTGRTFFAKTIIGEGLSLSHEPAGGESFPASIQSQETSERQERIKGPGLFLSATSSDAPGRRSIRIMYRNIKRVFLRAYVIDPNEYLTEDRVHFDSHVPTASWNIDLPPAEDHVDHIAFTGLPMGLSPGLYLIAASDREDFTEKYEIVSRVWIGISDLVLMRGPGAASLSAPSTLMEDVLVLSGESGRPLSGVAVDLLKKEWNKSPILKETRITDHSGSVRFSMPANDPEDYILMARKGSDFILYDSRFDFEKPAGDTETCSALIYTDRSVYKPGDRIRWKILLDNDRDHPGQPNPGKGKIVKVWLEDATENKKAEASVQTGDFGTASGEFEAPASQRWDRNWNIRSMPEGLAAIRIEEYSGRAFEVSVPDPEKPLRLGSRAVLKVRARYPSGKPVASGRAFWKIESRSIIPDNDGAGVWIHGTKALAAGRQELGPDGSFETTFVPEHIGDSSEYCEITINIDIADANGNFRSFLRSFRVSEAELDPRIEAELGFYKAGKPGEFNIVRQDPAGIPRPGFGNWRLVGLVEPKETLLPADQPHPSSTKYGTPDLPENRGPEQRARWDNSFCGSEVMSLWEEGPKIADGPIEHDRTGMSRIITPGLEPGPYRLVYETVDDHGLSAAESLDFLVVSGKKDICRIPLFLSAEKNSVPGGATARFLAGSGWRGQPVLMEAFYDGRLKERRWIKLGPAFSVIKISIPSDIVSTLGLRLTAVRDHQKMSQEATVVVPRKMKELSLSLPAHKSALSLTPGEKLPIAVKGPDGKPVKKGEVELLAFIYSRDMDLLAPSGHPQPHNIGPRKPCGIDWDDSLDRVNGGFVGSVAINILDDISDMFNSDDAKPPYLKYDQFGGVAPGVFGSAGSDIKGWALARAHNKDFPGFVGTAVWEPHLLTGMDGTAALEFAALDPSRDWRIVIYAVGRDHSIGYIEADIQTHK